MNRRSPDLPIVIATFNAGKVREIHAALSPLPIKLLSLHDFPNILPVDEVGQTYQENAALKALGYSRQTGACALADDSGLEVDALDGQPGVLSARFAGPEASDPERNQKLLAALQGSQKRSARFVCSMALGGWTPGKTLIEIENDEPHLLKITEARCEGSIAAHSRGDHGFGFDPLFVPEGYDATFGELSDEVKARISHRARALAQMREFLERWLPEN